MFVILRCEREARASKDDGFDQRIAAVAPLIAVTSGALSCSALAASDFTA